MTRNDRQNWHVFITLLIMLGGASLAALVVGGTSDESIRLPVRSTAQLAFVLYLIILVARAAAAVCCAKGGPLPCYAVGA